MDPPCQFLEWDSCFFGLRIAKSIVPLRTKEDLISVTDWCKQEAIDCLYLLADADDSDTNHIAQEGRFNCVDIRITLERNLDHRNKVVTNQFPGIVRDANKDDIPGLKAIAKINHRDSRFYYDGHFPRESCDRLYETWIEKSVNGYAERVFIAEEDHRSVGYITCDTSDNQYGQIGLVGVSPDSQGKGVGKLLLDHALNWFEKKGMHRVSVVTQGRNVKAQRLYQRFGFVTHSVQLWYHKWFERN